MRKNLVVALLATAILGMLAGVGQAALIFADSATSSGVLNDTALTGKPDAAFSTFDQGGSAYLGFGGYFQDNPGGDFVVYLQITEPAVNVSARQSDGTWVTLDYVIGWDVRRVYEIPGTGTAYFDMIRLAWDDSLPILNGVNAGGVTNVAPVPEPGTMMLLGSGLVGLAAYGRKKFRK